MIKIGFIVVFSFFGMSFIYSEDGVPVPSVYSNYTSKPAVRENIIYYTNTRSTSNAVQEPKRKGTSFAQMAKNIEKKSSTERRSVSTSFSSFATSLRKSHETPTHNVEVVPSSNIETTPAFDFNF